MPALEFEWKSITWLVSHSARQLAERLVSDSEKSFVCRSAAELALLLERQFLFLEQVRHPVPWVEEV